MRRAWIVAIALMGMVAVTAWAAGRSHSVSIRGSQFSPASLTVKTGDTVVWTNADDRDHSIAAADGSFRSENLRSGASFDHTFSKAGTYSYSCSYHPRERGVIVVKD